MMTLDEWVAEEKARLERFDAFSRTEISKHPEWYGRMKGSDWDEAYQTFRDDVTEVKRWIGIN